MILIYFNGRRLKQPTHKPGNLGTALCSSPAVQTMHSAQHSICLLGELAVLRIKGTQNTTHAQQFTKPTPQMA